MASTSWSRRARGLVAAALLAAGSVALFQHDHADHEGTLVHLEEDHGSHGATAAPAAERLPSAGQAAVPTLPAQVAALPDLSGPVVRGVQPAAHGPVRAAGRDPPAALGSRAPPA